jgi:hypothetical protein
LLKGFNLNPGVEITRNKKTEGLSFRILPEVSLSDGRIIREQGAYPDRPKGVEGLEKSKKV